jgi:hypothetical protein
LRVVGLNDVTSYGKQFTRIYDRPEYVPMMRTTFHTIEITIRTAQGDLAPFQFGPSLVKVHIRPVSSSTNRHKK